MQHLMLCSYVHKHAQSFQILTQMFVSFLCRPPQQNSPKWLYKLRGRNSGQLPAKTGSNYYLAGLVDAKISEKIRIKTINFCKMIVDCFI